VRTDGNNGKVDGVHKMLHCNVCGKTFKSSRHLRVHMVTRSEDRPFPCDVCNKKFKRAYELKIHKKVHSGEVNFSCEICGYATLTKFKLMLHQKRHFNQCDFHCEVCSKGTTVSLSLTSTEQFMRALSPSSVRFVVMGIHIKTTWLFI
jgi:KRAB domain-containing zinc finger protein